MSDSDFLEKMDKLIYMEDMDQRYKGNNINLVGKIQGQSKEVQNKLKNLDYNDDDDDDGYKKEKKNKFLAQQHEDLMEKERKRSDKHILPVEKFYNKRTGGTENRVRFFESLLCLDDTPL